MNIRQKRLADAIRQYASEDILNFEQIRPHNFGMVSVIEVDVSEDYSYADIYVSSQFEEKGLPHYLAQCADTIRKRIGKDFSLRKIPLLRMKTRKGKNTFADVLSLIHSLDSQYGLSHENSQSHKTV